MFFLKTQVISFVIFSYQRNHVLQYKKVKILPSFFIHPNVPEAYACFLNLNLIICSSYEHSFTKEAIATQIQKCYKDDNTKIFCLPSHLAEIQLKQYFQGRCWKIVFHVFLMLLYILLCVSKMTHEYIMKFFLLGLYLH